MINKNDVERRITLEIPVQNVETVKESGRWNRLGI